MNILHVVPTYLPARRYGGPIVAVHGLCRALVARGHSVDVFTTNVDGDATLDVPVGTAVDLDGVRVHYFPSSFRRLYWSPMMRRALQSRVRDYDVVHTHAVYLWPGVAAARAARRAAIPYIIAPRGMLVPALIRQKSRLVKTAWLRLFERSGFANAAAIHFTSALELLEAQRLGVLPLPKPIVIGNGIDLAPVPAVDRDPRLLIHLGRISWKKRIDLAIGELERLPATRLLIVGNDEENLTPSLQRIAAERGVADRVEFAGAVYGAAKDRLLAGAALFILLSDSENFGNAVLEALAMETPAVLSAAVGVAEEVQEAGAGIIGTGGLAALLDDAPRRREMGQNGRALVEARFTWEAIAEQMERAYLEARLPRRAVE